MYHLKHILFLASLFLSGFNLHSQNPQATLNRVQEKLNKVTNYIADIHIWVDLPYISLMPIDTKIYFKQKDKFKMDTKSIAVLPKQGFLQLNKLMSDSVNYTAISQNKDEVNGIQTSLINLIPNNDTSDLVLAKLWVDEKNQVIIKSLVTTKSSGTMKTEYTFGTYVDKGLPDKIIFMVDVKKFKVPKALAADINTSKSEKAEKKTGEIVITLKNYVINKGIPDSFFSN
jgi:outer membrane lipoprotein-sorting protein